MKIFPAIDILNGSCVRLTKGNYDTAKVYDENPVEIAHKFRVAGAEFLHVVDLDAAKIPAINNRPLIGQLINQSGLKVQAGGGIRTEADLIQMLEKGAYRVILGSVAVTQADLVKNWIKLYGCEKIVIGADVLNGYIATHGWQSVSKISVMDFLYDFMEAGARIFLCTDISKDGMLGGSAADLYRSILRKFPDISLIASGGVSSLDEIRKLQMIGMESVIVGKAIYEGRILPEDLFKKS